MSLDTTETVFITLVSKDGKEFKIDKEYATGMSVFIKTALEQDEKTTTLDVPRVTGDTLQRVVKYIEHYEGKTQQIIKSPLSSKEMVKVCNNEWDAKFIENIMTNKQELYDVILAANYMDIKCLLHLGCAAVASLIKGEPTDKIKEILKTQSK